MRALVRPPEALLRLARAQAGLVSAGQCDAHGVNSHRRSRLVDQRRWSRPARGVYGVDPPADGPARPEDHAARATWVALLTYGPEAVAVGPSALTMLGVQGVSWSTPAQVALPGARAAESRDGVLLRQFDDGMTVRRVAGRYVASPEWALAQAVPEMGRRRAVAVMDSAQHLGLLDPPGLRRAHDLARGRRGVARTHAWWGMSDARAESPLETFARLDCHDADVPPDDLQGEVRSPDGRNLLGRADMGWRLPGGWWLVAEVDGRRYHEGREAFVRDRRRQNALVADGRVDILRFTADDLRVRRAVGETVARHLARARGYAGSNPFVGTRVGPSRPSSRVRRGEAW